MSGLSLAWSETPKTNFLPTWAIYQSHDTFCNPVGPGFVTITRKMRSQKDEPCILHWYSNGNDTSVYLYENLTQGSVLKELCQKCKKNILKKKSENRGYLSAILSSLRFLTRQGISFLAKNSLSSGPVLRHLTESSITTTEINL